MAEMQNDVPSWDSIPVPPFDRICFHLRTDADCADLANFSMVSPYFHTGVKKFMKTANNRPAVDLVHVSKSLTGLKVELGLFPSNLPFYDLATLDMGRCQREGSTLRVTVTGSKDPIIKELALLLSAPVARVALTNQHGFTERDLTVCKQLLQSSSVDSIFIFRVLIADSTVAPLMSILNRVTKSISMHVEEGRRRLTDAAAFLSQLGSLTASSVHLHDYAPLFISFDTFCGITLRYWESFLDENLTNGSLEYVCTELFGEEITKAPVTLPDDHPTSCINWKRKE